MYDTHSLAEWAEALLLALSVYAAGSALVFLICDADASDFDPRPALRRTVAAAHQGLVHAGHDLNRAYATASDAVRTAGRSSAEAWRDLAALVLLLTTSPNGATHV